MSVFRIDEVGQSLASLSTMAGRNSGSELCVTAARLQIIDAKPGILGVQEDLSTRSCVQEQMLLILGSRWGEDCGEAILSGCRSMMNLSF